MPVSKDDDEHVAGGLFQACQIQSIVFQNILEDGEIVFELAFKGTLHHGAASLKKCPTSTFSERETRVTSPLISV